MAHTLFWNMIGAFKLNWERSWLWNITRPHLREIPFSEGFCTPRNFIKKLHVMLTRHMDQCTQTLIFDHLYKAQCQSDQCLQKEWTLHSKTQLTFSGDLINLRNSSWKIFTFIFVFLRRFMTSFVHLSSSQSIFCCHLCHKK